MAINDESHATSHQKDPLKLRLQVKRQTERERERERERADCGINNCVRYFRRKVALELHNANHIHSTTYFHVFSLSGIVPISIRNISTRMPTRKKAIIVPKTPLNNR